MVFSEEVLIDPLKLLIFYYNYRYLILIKRVEVNLFKID